MLSDKQLEQLRVYIEGWLRERPSTESTLVLDRKIVSGLVPELKAHNRTSAPYLEQLLKGNDSPTVIAGSEELKELTVDIQLLQIVRKTVG